LPSRNLPRCALFALKRVHQIEKAQRVVTVCVSAIARRSARPGFLNAQCAIKVHNDFIARHGVDGGFREWK
jgi:hypothetical protein